MRGSHSIATDSASYILIVLLIELIGQGVCWAQTLGELPRAVEEGFPAGGLKRSLPVQVHCDTAELGPDLGAVSRRGMPVVPTPST